MPDEFSGNVKPWLDAPWTELCRYDAATKKMHLVDDPEALATLPKLAEFQKHGISVQR